MLNHPTFEKLRTLRLSGMLQALQEQAHMPEIEALSFEERLGLLVDREATERENRRLQTRLRKANLRQQASIEDLDFHAARGLGRALVMRLAGCQWVEARHNVLITGPTGVGKSYLGCALAHKACLEGYSAFYQRLPRLLEQLHLAKAEQHDLLEVIDDRHDRRSTIVTSQLAVEHWHETMTDPTLADAILDRLIHAAYRLTLRGDSMRKKRAELLESEQMS